MDLKKLTAHDIREELLLHYTEVIMLREIEIYQLRKQRMNNKIQRYFNSTTNRNVFGRVLCTEAFKVYRDPSYQGITKKEVSDKLELSLQSIIEMMDTCVAECWAMCHPQSDKHFYGTPYQVEKCSDYANAYNALTSSNLMQKHDKLREFDKITSSHFNLIEYQNANKLCTGGE